MAVLFFFTEPKTIYDCTAFLCAVQFYLCCSSLWCRGGRFIYNKWTRLYTYCCAALIICGLGASIYLKFTDPKQQDFIYSMDKLLMSISFLELFMSVCMFTTSVISMERFVKQHAKLYDHVHAMDLRLMREFGVNMNYHKLKRKNIVVFAVLLLAYSSALISTVTHIANGDFMLMFLGAFCYGVVTGGPHFSGYVHMNLAEIVKIRFRLMQKILNEDYLVKRFDKTEERERRLESAIETVKELYYFINKINAVYHLNLLACLAHDFTLTTSELYIIFSAFVGTHSSYRLVWIVGTCMLPPAYKMLRAPVFCDNAMKEGKKCLGIIQHVDRWFPKSAPVSRMVSSMMFWSLENKIHFHCYLNISLNKTTISVITTVVINYLLILVQFRMTEEMGDQIGQTKNILQEWIGGDE